MSEPFWKEVSSLGRLTLFAKLGQMTFFFFSELGWFAVFAWKAATGIVLHKWSREDLWEQLEAVGVNSVLMVAVTSAFTGMVMAVQTLDQFIRFGATAYIGGVVGLTLVRELSPVLTGLVVAGRVGASMAAEIGTMRVTEQIDALKAFGLNDFTFIGAPRLIAGVIMLPVLTVFSITIGIFGGFLYVVAHGVTPSLFIHSIQAMLTGYDLYGGLLKSALFGFLITVSACGEGFKAENGARGVGLATTGAVVWGDMFILVFNYIMSALLFGGKG